MLQKFFLLFLMVFLLNTCPCVCQNKVLIFIPDTKSEIDSKATGVSEASIEHAFQGEIARKLEKAFPCARTITADEIRAMIQYERMKSLLGGSSSADLSEYAQAMNGEYLASSSVGKIGSQWLLTINLSSTITYRTSARATAKVGSLDALIESGVDKAVEELSEAEICPWKGKINITAEINYDSSRGETLSHGGTQTRQSDREKITMNQKAEIEITAKGSTYKTSVAKGKLQFSETYDHTYIENSTGEVICYIYYEPCSITDTWKKGTFSFFKRTETGHFQLTQQLNKLNFSIWFDPEKSDRYILKLESKDAFEFPKGEFIEKEELSNSCGVCSPPEKKSEVGPINMMPVNIVVEGKGKRTDKELSGSVQYNIEDLFKAENKKIRKSPTETITWHLTK